MNNEVYDAFIEQRKDKEIKSLYHLTQISFAYHSNKIEGSCLNEKQTELIYDAGCVNFNENKDPVRIDDVIEMRNHFYLFDYMLDTYDEPLNEQLILKYHSILKAGTSQSFDPEYNLSVM